MVNKTISLPEELNNRLKYEENASLLISNLLRHHYEISGNSKEDLLKKKEQLERNLSEMLQEKEKDVYVIEKQIENIEVEEKVQYETIEEQAQKLKNRIANVIENSFDIFGVQVSEAQAEEYIKDADVKTLMDFLIEKGLYKEPVDLEAQENAEN